MRAVSTLGRAARARALSTAVREAGVDKPLVNAVHISDENPPPTFTPIDNGPKIPAPSRAHWDAEWTEAQLAQAIDKNVMMTWGPSAMKTAVPEIVRGEGVYLYDRAGKRYMDWTSQAVCSNFGHTVPEPVAGAIADQLDKIAYVYSGLGMTEIRARLSALLGELCPADIDGFLFASGGAEANEAAIGIARRYTGKPKILTYYRSYHGGTTGTLSATGDFRRVFAENAAPATGFVKMHSPAPTHYNMGASEEEVVANSLALLEDQILMEGPSTIAAIMIESIIGSGGVFVHPEGYVQGVRALCDKYEMLLIMDEVMVGFGRTGTMWGFQNYAGVVPDIMTSAKGLSGSYLPLAMVGVRAPIQKHFESTPLGWGATFQAHPVALRCAYECVKYMVDHDLVARVKGLEPVLLEEIQRLIDEHPSVKQGRGVGLFGCVDTMGPSGRLSQQLGAPMPAENQAFKRALLDNGIYGLLRMPLVHICPPLIVTEDELRDGFDRVGKAMSETLDKQF